ncbi:uncharacterized protein LOC142765646 isoform X2 [Rhipicephalus microplus]|uniref:uncharacterized protein LOC142765646 isoform X2 n=1 Tax=Rhipicephalus microplus TaxID=6941 RepID=UPI003F6D3DA0
MTTGMLKVTALALVFTAIARFCNAAEANDPKTIRSTYGTIVSNVFKEFWTKYKKVWTANSTVPFYNCEWQEPTDVTENGLQIITHFDTTNSFKLNWTFAGNNSMKSILQEGVFRRYMEYQNGTCAVFKDEFWRIVTPEETKDPSTEKMPKVKTKLAFTSVDYRMVFDDTKRGHVPNDCRKKYRTVVMTAPNYRIYQKACKKTEAEKHPFTITVGF